MKRYLLLYLIFLLTIWGEGIEAKTRGLSSLRIGVGGRAVGMGEAFSAVSNGAISTYWNPAGLVETDRYELVTAHNKWLFDVSSEFISFASNRGYYVLGLSFYYMDMGKIEARTFRNEKDPIGFFRANDISLGISFAKKIKKEFDIGVTLKYLYEKIYMEKSSGYAFDIGMRYHLFKDFIDTGIVIKNLGTMTKMRNKKISLPTTYRAGIMCDLSKIFNKKDFLFISSDYEISPDYNNHLMFGLETRVSEVFAIRFGYQNGYRERNFCGGIGIGLNFIRVDYGFTPFSSDLGNTHRFSLKFNW